MKIEPKVQIGEYVLSEAQATTLRVALTSFHSALLLLDTRESLGSITDAYKDRAIEVLRVFQQEQRDG